MTQGVLPGPTALVFVMPLGFKDKQRAQAGLFMFGSLRFPTQLTPGFSMHRLAMDCLFQNQSGTGEGTRGSALSGALDSGLHHCLDKFEKLAHVNLTRLRKAPGAGQCPLSTQAGG